MKSIWYFYLDGAKAVGPLDEVEVLNRIRDRRVGPYQLMLRDGEKEWVPALSFPEFRDVLASVKTSSQLSKPWIVMRAPEGTTQPESLGPFSASEVQQLLKAGKIQYVDYAWKDGMHQWRRIGQLKDFALEPKPSITPPPLAEPKLPLLEKIEKPEVMKTVEVVSKVPPVAPQEILPPEADGDDLVELEASYPSVVTEPPTTVQRRPDLPPEIMRPDPAKDPTAKIPVAKNPSAKVPIAKEPTAKVPISQVTRDPVTKERILRPSKDPTGKVSVPSAAPTSKQRLPLPPRGADTIESIGEKSGVTGSGSLSIDETQVKGPPQIDEQTKTAHVTRIGEATQISEMSPTATQPPVIDISKPAAKHVRITEVPKVTPPENLKVPQETSKSKSSQNHPALPSKLKLPDSASEKPPSLEPPKLKGDTSKLDVRPANDTTANIRRSKVTGPVKLDVPPDANGGPVDLGGEAPPEMLPLPPTPPNAEPVIVQGDSRQTLDRRGRKRSNDRDRRSRRKQGSFFERLIRMELELPANWKQYAVVAVVVAVAGLKIFGPENVNRSIIEAPPPVAPAPVAPPVPAPPPVAEVPVAPPPAAAAPQSRQANMPESNEIEPEEAPAPAAPPATRLRIRVAQSPDIASLVLETNAPPDQPVWLEVTGAAGQVVDHSHFYRKWAWHSSQAKTLAMDALPAGYFHVSATAGNLVDESHFEIGTHTKGFSDRLRWSRKRMAYEYWSERKNLLFASRQLNKLLSANRKNYSAIDRIGHVDPTKYAFFDLWKELKDICKQSHRPEPNGAKDRVAVLQSKVGQLTVWK